MGILKALFGSMFMKEKRKLRDKIRAEIFAQADALKAAARKQSPVTGSLTDGAIDQMAAKAWAVCDEAL